MNGVEKWWRCLVVFVWRERTKGDERSWLLSTWLMRISKFEVVVVVCCWQTIGLWLNTFSLAAPLIVGVGLLLVVLVVLVLHRLLILLVLGFPLTFLPTHYAFFRVTLHRFLRTSSLSPCPSCSWFPLTSPLTTPLTTPDFTQILANVIVVSADIPIKQARQHTRQRPKRIRPTHAFGRRPLLLQLMLSISSRLLQLTFSKLSRLVTTTSVCTVVDESLLSWLGRRCFFGSWTAFIMFWSSCGRLVVCFVAWGNGVQFFSW